MTLPDERYRALVQVRERLLGLVLVSGRLAKRELRREFFHAFKHFPTTSEIDQLAEARPDILRKEWK